MREKIHSYSRWSLQFDDQEIEQAYSVFDPQNDLGLTRVLLAVLAVFLILDPIVWTIFHDSTWSGFRSFELLFGLLLLASLVASYSSIVMYYRRFITTIILLISISLVYAMLITSSEVITRALAPIWNLLMLVNAILTPRIKVKFVINAFIAIVAIHWYQGTNLFSERESIAHSSISGLTFMLATAVAYGMESARRQRFLAELTAEHEHQKSEKILFNALPKAVAERLKTASESDRIVDYSENVAILFVDIVGFTSYAASREATQVVDELDALFARFDVVVAQHRLEKIKTIGDAYMAIAGLPNAHPDPAGSAAEAALDLLAVIERLRALGAAPFSIRIGINIGPVVAGVIGRSRFQYDLWGDSVNVASRLESSGEAGKIHVSDNFAQILRGRYHFESRGKVSLKGRGEVESHFLLGRIFGAS